MPVRPPVSYPGVYVQEVPSGVRSIAGVSTSIAVFMGRAKQGPMGKREMERLAIEIGCAAQETDSNMPFIADTFHKSVRHMVKDAKGEIDSFVNAKVMQTGLKALKDNAPELPENTVKIIEAKPAQIIDVEPVKEDADEIE